MSSVLYRAHIILMLLIYQKMELIEIHIRQYLHNLFRFEDGRKYNTYNKSIQCEYGPYGVPIAGSV